MTSIDVLIKHHDLVMFSDVTEHILPFNSVKDGLINYSIFKMFNFMLIHSGYPSG